MSEQHLGTKMDACTETQTKIFKIQNPDLFDDDHDHSPNFENPTQIGYFSLDKDRKFVIPKESYKKSLKYFIRPEDPEQVDFDLDKGNMKKKEKEWEFHLLKWIEENMDRFQKQEDSLTNRATEGPLGNDIPVNKQENPDPSSVQVQDPVNVQELATGISKVDISTKDKRATEGPLGNDIPVNKQENPDLLSVQVQDPVNVDQEPATGISEVDISTKDKRKFDFVCRRGLLAKIMCTPYVDKKNKKEHWLIAVKRHNGRYYLREIETKQQKKAEKNMADENKKMCCWGWKFEQYITADPKDGEPKPDEEYTYEAFYTVVKAKLGDHFLVFSGEVDAFNDKNKNYMEFKLSRRLAEKDQVGHFVRFADEETVPRCKLKKWWAQSYIIGVKDIVCGFRDDDGVVHKLKFYETEDLPALAEEDGYEPWDKPWKRNVCLNALDKFLTFIKSSITDDTSKVHTLKWKSGQPVQCVQYEPPEDENYNFFPVGFTETISKMDGFQF